MKYVIGPAAIAMGFYLSTMSFRVNERPIAYALFLGGGVVGALGFLVLIELP